MRLGSTGGVSVGSGAVGFKVGSTGAGREGTAGLAVRVDLGGLLTA